MPMQTCALELEKWEGEWRNMRGFLLKVFREPPFFLACCTYICAHTVTRTRREGERGNETEIERESAREIYTYMYIYIYIYMYVYIYMYIF